MNSVTQHAKGNNNNQVVNYFNRPLDIVDICAPRISAILERINTTNSENITSTVKLVPPEIEKKHLINSVDFANAIEIERTYALWSELTSAIGIDTSGRMNELYFNATKLLNSLYLAMYQGKFPEFRIHVITVYASRHSTIDQIEDSISLGHLVNYMYLNCQIGVIP